MECNEWACLNWARDHFDPHFYLQGWWNSQKYQTIWFRSNSAFQLNWTIETAYSVYLRHPVFCFVGAHTSTSSCIVSSLLLLLLDSACFKQASSSLSQLATLPWWTTACVFHVFLKLSWNCFEWNTRKRIFIRHENPNSVCISPFLRLLCLLG